MKNNFNSEAIIGEIQASVSFTSFMTAVTVFFVGLLITQFNNFNNSIKIPILFLIISTSGFLYATLIYSNASGKVARHSILDVDKDMILGNALAEYMGLYFLVLSIPLVINIITGDLFLMVATLIVILGGLIVYHVSGFSIMMRNFPKYHWLFLALIVFCELAMFIGQIKNTTLLVIFSIVITLLMICLTFFAKNEYR